MKKDHVRDYAVAAFRLYSARGCPSREQAESEIRRACFAEYSYCEPQTILRKAEKALRDKTPELADIDAVDKMLLLLTETGKAHIAVAVREVYFVSPKAPVKKGDITQRVIRLSLSMPASTQAIYKWLREARMLFALLRGLRIE